MENHSDSTIVGPSLVPKLEILRGDGRGTIFTLKFKTRLGRESDNDIILSDPKVSRYHCQVTFEDGKWVLTDLGSANGTLHNGLPVTVPQTLTHGSQITLGDTILAFVDPMDATEKPIDPSATIIGGKLPPAKANPAAKSNSAVWLGGIGVLLLLIAAVAVLLWLRRTPTETPAAKPTAKPTIALIRTTPVNKALVLKYEDDFSDSSSGWDDAFGQSYTKQYGNNQYHIEITTSNLVVWGLANRNAADFEMEVEATSQTADTGITYGIIFRYVDDDNYYRFDISPDGFFLLTKFENGEWHTLVDWTASDAINTGQTTNVLKVSAFGNEIAVFANGQELARITDDSFSSGNFGFFTSTFDSDHSWVSFDNLKLWAPQNEEIALIPTPTPAPPMAEIAPAPQSETDQLPTETPAPATGTAAPSEPTPAATETIAATATAVATVAPPTPLPDFVTPDQPLARGTSRLAGKIIFPVYDPDRGTYDIFRANTDGSDREQLFAEASQPAANSTGDTLAYRSWRADNRGLISQKIGETDQWVFEKFFESASPAFSPGGDFFVFHSRAGRDTPALYRTVGTERDVLRRNSAPIEGEMVAFTPDGRIVYRGCLGNVCGIIRSNLDGGDPLALTDNADDTAPAVSPDGKTVAFMSNRSGDWDVFTIGIDGKNLQQLTTSDGSDGIPTWSPDGKNIAFASNRDGEWAIWAMTATGKNERQLFKTNGSVDGIVQIDTAHSFGWLEEHIVWTK